MQIEKVVKYEITVSERELKQLSSIFWAARHTTVDRSVPERALKFKEIVDKVIY